MTRPQRDVVAEKIAWTIVRDVSADEAVDDRRRATWGSVANKAAQQSWETPATWKCRPRETMSDISTANEAVGRSWGDNTKDETA